MRKYRNTKIVKSILLGLPVLFCSCYNNDSIKNGHCEDERDFRREGEVVKIYDKTGKDGKFLKEVTVNKELSIEKLNRILDHFNDILNGYSLTSQQSILNQFDTTKVYNTLSDFCVEFCLARVQEFEKGLCMNSGFSEKNKGKLVKWFVINIGHDFYHTQTYLDEKDMESFLKKYTEISYGFYCKKYMQIPSNKKENLR